MHPEEAVSLKILDIRVHPNPLTLRLRYGLHCRFPVEEPILPADLSWVASRLLIP
jgi:hypothetical protein